MPTKATIEKAREDARQGEAPSTQAGEFVSEEIGDIWQGMDKADLIETLRGQGTGISKSGKTPVEYELNIYQHWIKVRNDDRVPARKEIRGWIHPRFGDDREVLTIEFNDRSTLSFSYSGKDEAVAGNGEIVRPL